MSVNERIIKLICNQYNVNEEWLKEGRGKMFSDEPDVKQKYAMSIFKKLRPEFQDCALELTD